MMKYGRSPVRNLVVALAVTSLSTAIPPEDRLWAQAQPGPAQPGPAQPGPAQARQAQPRQDCTEIPIPAKLQDPSNVRTVRGQYGRLRFKNADRPSDDDKQVIKEWLVDYHIRRFTHKSEFHRLPELREELLSQVRIPQSKGIYDYAANLTLTSMKVLLDGANYCNEARVNAVLTIGELNESEADFIGQRLPVPLPEARDVLLTVVEDPDGKYNDGLKIAAMAGILRHARLVGGRMGQADRISTAMLSLLEQKTPPDGRSPEGHAWMQRRAIDVLAAMGRPGDGNAAFDSIYALLADDSAPLSLRCSAAEGLGKLNYNGSVGVNGMQLVTSYLDFALTALQDEIARLDADLAELKARDDTNDPAAGHAGQTGPFQSADQDPVPQYKLDSARRRVSHVLTCVKTGLKGPQGQTGGIAPLVGADGAAKSKIDGLEQQAVAVIDGIYRENRLDAIAQQIRAAAANLSRLRGGAVPAAATPPTSPDTAAPPAVDATAPPPPAEPPANDPLDFP